MGVLKARDLVTGGWLPISTAGSAGMQGPPGQPFIVVGYFGATKIPADLPVNGSIPVDWDAPGSPAVGHQMVLAEAMYYDPTDPDVVDAGHLYQFVGTMSPTGWTDVGLLRGKQGPTGVSTVIVGDFGARPRPPTCRRTGCCRSTGTVPATRRPPPDGGRAGALYYDKPADHPRRPPVPVRHCRHRPDRLAGHRLDPGSARDRRDRTGPIGPPGDDVWVGPDDPTTDRRPPNSGSTPTTTACSARTTCRSAALPTTCCPRPPISTATSVGGTSTRCRRAR